MAYSHSAGLVAKVGEALSGADGVLELSIDDSDLPPVTAQRFAYVKPGVRLRVSGRDAMNLAQTWTAQMWLLKEDAQGRILAATATQLPGALDDAYALAESSAELGATVTPQRSTFRLWAPTAQRVMLCLHPQSPARVRPPCCARCSAKTPPACGPRNCRKTCTASATATWWTWSPQTPAWCATA
ncbi:hypothetical protein [Ideonella paludis]|uniref:hypothetical protein n=1 Tax=Ideonella paludis TaxID=1233411 RepID=UPI003641EB84